MDSQSESPAPECVAHYRLVERIAVGGMAEVYRAVATQRAGAERSVVVKRMLPRIASEPSARAMFAEEARLGSHVRHPNVVQVLDFGDASDHPYLVLEYVQGVDLWRLMRHLIRTGRSLMVPQALYVAREMLAGLHAVHEATDERGNRLGVVHQDVSPSNVLLSVHGDVKLGDLGIARSRLREKFPSRSVSERAKGKLGYLAPEQVRGEGSDRRADIFSAGVVIAELLMGRPLFSGGSELAVLLAIRDSMVHPFVEFAKQLPSGLAEIIIEALAQKPARRPASAELFSSRLLAHQTEPESALRAGVAQLVMEAVDGGASPLTLSLTPTRAFPDGESLFARNPERDDVATPVVSVSGMPAVETQTPSVVRAIYVVRTSGGEQLGPWSLAEAVQAISTHKIAGQDQVLVEGQQPRALVDVPELARHLPSATVTTNRLVTPRGGMRLPAEQCSMEDGGLIVKLAHAAIERVTALMLCELGGVRKEIYLENGIPAFVTSNLASELLGEHLVSRRVISRSELDMALAVMPRFEGRLGDTLSALGLVEPVVLFRHIAEQVREKLLDLFVWNAGSCTVYQGVAAPPSGFPLNLDAWEVLDAGLARRIECNMEDALLLRLRDRRLLPASGPHLTAMRPSLPRRLKALLSALDAPMPLHLLVQRASYEGGLPQATRDALLLMYLGALRFPE